MATIERDVVREAMDDHPRLAQSILAVLKQARAEMVEQLGTIECKDFAEYRNRRGKIDGLDMAISLCQETQRKLEA